MDQFAPPTLDEFPVPKSSMASLTPREGSSSNTRAAASRSVLRTLSVTSRWRWSGERPQLAAASATWGTKSGSSSCATKRLRETLSAG